MTVSSANPDRLDTFVGDAPAPRLATADLAQRGATLAAGVMSRCAGRGLSAHNFGAVAALVETMLADENFVRGVADALRTADRHDGIATMSDIAIGTRLVDGSYDTEAPPVTMQPVALLGEPANSGLIDDPICAANGNFIHRDLDLVFPGTSAALDVHRFYNSLAADRIGAFGAGWTSVFDVALIGIEHAAVTDTVTARLADGAEVAFHRADDAWRTTDRRRVTLVAAGRGWELQLGDTGERRWRFDRHGRASAWQVGRVTVTVTRDEAGRIASLHHDRSGRRIQVTWAGDRIAAIASDDGRTVAYTYGERQTLVRAESRSGWFDYSYDSRLLLTATDPDGVTQFRNEYDGDGRVIRQTSPFGRVTTYRYEMPGATVVTDQDGVRQAMVHDARGNLTAIIDADGAIMRLTHDAHDRVVQVVSQTGDTWHHEFDPLTGDLVRRTDPDGLTQSWRWDAARRLVATVDRAGATTRFEYDGDHLTPSIVIEPDGSTVTVELDRWGQPVVVTDADGVVSRFVWDRDGQLAGVTDAVGRTTTMEFEASGLLVRLLDPAGAVTELSYDHAARLVRGTTGARVHEFRYTPGGRVAGGVDPAEGAWSAVFGHHGAVTSITGATGATLRRRYDVVGNLVALVGADGAEYHQEFDAVGRLVVARAPDGGGTRLEYDVAGRVVAVTDGEGRTHRRTFDPLGRTAEVTAPDGAITRWTHHPGGEVATVTVADGRQWGTEVDALGRIVAVTDPAGRRASRTYTPAGRLASRTDPDGHTERFEYDTAGRCVGVVCGVVGNDGMRVRLDLDAADRVIAEVVSVGDRSARRTFEWDRNGGLAACTDSLGTTRWRRDEAGRVVAEIDGTGAEQRFAYDPRGLLAAATDTAGNTTRYGYDVAGRLIEQVAPGGRTTTWGHDAIGMIRRVTDPSRVTTEVVRDATGIVTSLRRDGSGWDRRLDAAGREVVRTAPDGAEFARYAYDVAGRLVSAEAPLAGLLSEFVWDAADHLVSPRPSDHERPGRAAEASGDAAPLPRDAAGRLLVGPDGTVYRYDVAGRLAEIAPIRGAGATFEYGPDGLIATERVGGQARHFTYDASGRVATITVDGLGTSVFTYDTAGRRHSQTSPDGSTVVFGWSDVDQLVSITRTTSDGDVHHLAIDVDALGRPRRINGVDIDPGASAPVAVAGVVVLGARVYDPLTHQFLSADPLMVRPGSNGAASAYTYAWHDPVNHVDPTGLRPISIDDYERMRTLEEQGRLGQAWQAIQDDPFGTLLMVGVVGAAFMIGGPIGVGIVVGAGMMAANGLATGTFDPMSVAIGGAAGGLTAGIGSSSLGVGSAMLANGAVGAGAEAGRQYFAGGTVNWGQVLAAGGGAAVTGGLAQATNASGTTLVRSVLIGAGSDASGSAVEQTLTGRNPISWDTVVAGVGGAATNGFTYAITPRPASYDITPTAEAPTIRQPTPNGVTVYRGTANTLELAIHDRTGLLMSDAARSAYATSGGSVDAALAASTAAHGDGIAAWSTELEYAQAHGAFGSELSQVGPRSFVSVTTDFDVAKYFAGDNGRVLSAVVDPADLVPQTLPGAGESELLVRHMLEASG